MTTQHELADAFRRLTSALAGVEEDAPGRERATGIRKRLAVYIDNILVSLAGGGQRCHAHPAMPAHNCGLCRSERIGWASYDSD